MKKSLLLFAILPFILSCQNKIEHKNFKPLSTEDLQSDLQEYYGELNYAGYKLATTKLAKGTPCVQNTFDIEAIVNKEDAKNIIADFQKTATSKSDNRQPHYTFDIVAKIETPKKFYRNFKDNFLVDGTTSENKQAITLLNLVDFKKSGKYTDVKDARDLEEIPDYKLFNEKNEPMILKSYNAFNRGAKDYIKDDKTGKEYISYIFPEFVFDDTKINTFNKLKGTIDFDIEVPYKLEVKTVNHNDVGSIIKINGVEVEILAFENNVLHLKLADNSYADQKFTIFSKSCYESHQYYYSDYVLFRENPSLSMDDFEKFKVKHSLNKSEIKPPYVFVIRFSDHVDEVKLIAKQKDKVLRERIKVNVDIN